MSQREQQPADGPASSPLVAVAIDRDKNSQGAFRWALDNVVTRGQTLTLVHVNTKPSTGSEDAANIIKEVFVPFRCFCTRKNVQCNDVILDDTDVAKAIVEFVLRSAVGKLVIGSSPKGGFVRSFRSTDTSSSISKGVPDFCTVFIISKGKVSSMRNAARPPPTSALIRAQIQSQPTARPDPLDYNNRNNVMRVAHVNPPVLKAGSCASNRSPFTRGTRATKSFESPRKSVGGYSSSNGVSSLSYESSSSPAMDEVEAEIRRLRLELKQTMDMYSTACKEALTAKQKAMELQRWKTEEGKRLEEARLSEEAALALAEREKAKRMAAIETAEASKRIAELEAQKRISAELQAVKEAEEKIKAFDAMSHTNLRYRRYTIEEIEVATENFAENRKIGEGGYGPVYRGTLDHTPVAIKVLRPDAAQGRSQFQQEVEILCCIRHPNMVLLLGACPEYGCLVYEYMANGSLEDRLFRRGNTPPIPWQHRFRIAAEIGTGLLFLHQTKPEPLVHRDLKPANILLDRNYVSKISDVGLARLVPPSYQQTGMLGIKSDVYSMGILLLQLVTGKPPMGLTHYVERAIEKGTFEEMLDGSVPDWPVEDALSLAKLAVKCAELRRKDRPDLATGILPELNRLRNLAEENMQYSVLLGYSPLTSPMQSQVSTQDFMSAPSALQSGYESSRSRYSGSSVPGRT
uniref:RING-type E3 ubiquitin transferase n=1 Tax=Musa acuminata subsp. malaccensis TaxID=214687 RepID=A0A804ILG6_MUSAM